MLPKLDNIKMLQPAIQKDKQLLHEFMYNSNSHTNIVLVTFYGL